MIELPGQSRFLTVDGIKTHYLVAGEGPPLLLVHGLGASVVTWRDNIGPLSEAFRVYAIDLPGHGDTDKPDIDYATDYVLNFLVRFVEALGLRQVAVIGNSVGGALGQMMALRFPHLVSGLVLVDSASLGREISIYVRLTSLPFLGEFLERSKLGGARFILHNSFHDQSFVTEELVGELHRSRLMPGARQAVVRVIRNTVNLRGVRKEYVLVDQLKRLRVPMMVVWGAQDRVLPVSHAYRASERASNARLHVFEQCGHWAHMERAQAFNSLVLGFLSG